MILDVIDQPLDAPFVDGGTTPAGRHQANQQVERQPEDGLDTQPASSSSLGVTEQEAPSHRDRRGQLVAGRYRILSLLGRGGMGSVWLALDGALSRPVALKESWRSTLATNPGEDSTAVLEARAACVTSHPGVVRVYDLVVADGREWIVMEALSGISLAQAIKDAGPLPAERVVHIGLRLLEALGAIHREGVIHGDLKPSNVHLDGQGQPILTDFGLASGAGDAHVGDAAHVVGSPPYMAPEVIRTGCRSAASDLFALGATLYEAAEGRRPFDNTTPIATSLAVLHESPKPALGDVPLGRLIDGLLTKDPRHRLGAQDAYAWLKEIESELVWATSGAG